MPIEVSVTDQNVQVSTSGQTVNASVSGGVGPAGPAGATGATGATGPAGTTTWAGITDKPATFAPSAHASSHASAGSDPITVGTVSGRFVTTTTAGRLSTTQYIGLSQILNGMGTPATSLDTMIADIATYGNPYTISGSGTMQPPVHVHDTADITSGTVATARLASGTASASTYLRGDQTWAAISTYTLPAATTSTLGGVTYGTTAGTACQGNDSRLSDARTPTSHVHAASDITSGTLATARLGSGTASASTFLRGDQTYAAPPVTSVDGSAGDVTITKCTVYKFTRSSGPTGASGPTSTAIGDKTWQWAIPTNAKIIEILQVGAGAGGGSGRRGASATLRGGGGGGCGGQVRCSKFFYADRASNDLHIAIGSGGAGGASASADDANGSPGSSGGFTRVFWGSSASSTVLDYNGGVWDSTHAVLQNLTPISNGGAGGTSTAGGTGGSPSLQLQPAFSNPSGSSFGGAGGNGTTAAGVGFGDNFATCGGGGGGISSGNVAQAGADSAVPNHYGTTSLNSPGGAAGGGVGTARLGYPSMAYALGCGGPGGGANASGAGGDGAAGSFPGGGGGGGGASVNGSASGKGGNGGDGICYVIVWS